MSYRAGARIARLVYGKAHQRMDHLLKGSSRRRFLLKWPCSLMVYSTSVHTAYLLPPKTGQNAVSSP